jgi:hypothetical protein
LGHAILKSRPQDLHCLSLFQEAPKFMEILLKELVEQRLLGYYFLPLVEIDGDDRGFIVLLREIHLMPRKLARVIIGGIAKAELGELVRLDSSLEARLQILDGDMAMPLSVIRSPNVEHILQSFSLLFGRIGIVDTPAAYISGLWARQPTIKENPV